MEFRPEKRKKLTRWLIGIVVVCMIIGFGIQNLATVASALSWCIGILMPLIVGCAIAMILNVPIRFLETYLWRNSKKAFLCKARRPMAFVLSMLFILGILGGVFWIVIPELVEAIRIIVQSAIDLASKLSAMTDEELAAVPFGNLLLKVDWDQLLASLQEWLKNQSTNILDTVFGTITSLLGGIIHTFLSIIFAVYIVLGKEKIKKQTKHICRVWFPKRADKVLHVGSLLNLNFRNFIAGQTLEAAILALLCLIGMLILGFPYAPMISALVGVTALIPVVGAFVGGGVGAFMMLTEEPMKAVWFIVFFLVLQQLEENLIYPRVMGRHVNLPGMWVLAAVTVGGGIAGPIGMLLAVPLASTAYILFKEETKKREDALAAAEVPDMAEAKETGEKEEVPKDEENVPTEKNDNK